MQAIQLVGAELLGSRDEELDAIAQELKDGSSDTIAAALRMLPPDDQSKLVRKLFAIGVHPNIIEAAAQKAGVKVPLWMDPEKRKIGVTVWGVLGTVSMVASAYHGYARNGSIGWGLWWGLMGSLFPVITPTFAVAQCKREQDRFMLGCKK